MWQWTVYQIPLILSLLISFAVIAIILSRDPSPGSRYLMISMIAVFGWALTEFFNVGSTTLYTKLFWDNLSYIAIVTLPVSWILFVLEYTGRSKYITKISVGLMSFISLTIFSFVLTNEYHFLFRSEIFLKEVSGILVFGKTYGPLFWISILYFYLLILLGFLLLFQSMNFSHSAYRRQSISFLGAILLTLFANSLYISQIFTFPIDTTSVSFPLIGLVLLIGITKYQLLDIVPSAYSIFFKNMDDAAIILGRNSHIVEINPSMENLLEIEKNKIYGNKFQDISNKWPELNIVFTNMLSSNNFSKTTILKENKVFEMAVSKIYDSGKFLIGHLITLHDITNLKRMEDKLIESNKQIDDLNQTLKIINKILRHDIINKLTVVKYSLSLYKEKEDKKLLDKMDASIDGGIKLIERVRELEESILNKGELSPISIKKTVNEISKNIQVPVKIKGDAKILADEALFSVFENILNNAIIHGGADRIEINISSVDNICTIKIKDYGIGVPELIKDNIFNEGLSYGKNKGSGLGLFIAKKTIERYGGTIELRDNKPSGATFVIKLKRHSK